jgi:hypothetical protein
MGYRDGTWYGDRRDWEIDGGLPSDELSIDRDEVKLGSEYFSVSVSVLPEKAQRTHSEKRDSHRKIAA